MKFEQELVLEDVWNFNWQGHLRFESEFAFKDIDNLFDMKNKKVKLTLEVEEPILDDADI